MTYKIDHMEEELEVDFDIDVESINEKIHYIKSITSVKNFRVYLDVDDYIIIEASNGFTVIDPEDYQI